MDPLAEAAVDGDPPELHQHRTGRGVDEVPADLILEYGDLLFNRTNSLALVGKVGIFRGAQQDGVSFASYLVRLRAKKGKAVPYQVKQLLQLLERYNLQMEDE